MNDVPTWPDARHLLASHDQILAFGQITLTYNVLEDVIELLFEKNMPLDQDYAEKLFHQLNNRSRIDILSAFINHNEKDPGVKDHLLYAINCFDICTANRNILMHAWGTRDELNESILNLAKRSSNNPNRLLHFKVTVGELRQVADEIGGCFDHCIQVYRYLAHTRPDDRSTWASGGELPSTLPDKPPKPRMLTPFQPEEAPPK